MQRIPSENWTFHFVVNMARQLLLRAAMSSSLDSIYKKMASSLEQGGAGHVHEAKFDPARHVSPVVAHELNNILTIIQGYADRLLLKHGDNPALETHLKLISEAAHRASILVRSAAPPEAGLPPRSIPELPQQPTA
jgi:signal transduction histidine kinase